MTQLNKLLVYITARLETAGLTLSTFGRDEVEKRFNKSESNGGYSNYWRNL